MSEKKRNTLGIILLVILLITFKLGFDSKEVQAVFSKAVNICMECIGIG